MAVHGSAAVVRATNPARRLDAEQLQDVFAGRITIRRELGGLDRPIRAWVQPARTAAIEFIESDVMGEIAFAAAVKRDVEAARCVTADPAAIASVPLCSCVPIAARPLAISNGGIAVCPTHAGLHSEDYPLL